MPLQPRNGQKLAMTEKETHPNQAAGLRRKAEERTND